MAEPTAVDEVWAVTEDIGWQKEGVEVVHGSDIMMWGVDWKGPVAAREPSEVLGVGAGVKMNRRRPTAHNAASTHLQIVGNLNLKIMSVPFVP